MPSGTESPAQTPHISPSGWQARKSAATRRQIIEATLRCFSKLGYFHTTTPAIAEEAGLSRGAMLHHFPSRIDVVRAAVEHLHAKRLKAFRAAVDGLPSGENRAHAALRAHWEQLRHPLYAVFIELCVAARTDPELADILGPAEEAFVHELRATALRGGAGMARPGTKFRHWLRSRHLRAAGHGPEHAAARVRRSPARNSSGTWRSGWTNLPALDRWRKCTRGAESAARN